MSRFCTLILLLSASLSLFREVSAQNPVLVNYKNEAFLLKKLVAKEHYNPPPFDDVFSIKLFDSFLDVLDPARIIFTQAEITSLQVFRDKLDDEIDGKSWSFLPAVTAQYRKSLERAADAVLKGSTVPYGYKAKEYYTLDTAWAKDDATLYSRWQLFLKYEAGKRLAEMKGRFAGESDNTFLTKQEPAVRTLVKELQRAKINRALQHARGFDNYVGEMFLHAMSNTVDAHTNYFSPPEMENFMNQLTSEGFQFGFKLKENDLGDIVVEQLTPGGPAWKSGEIHAGDIIVRMRWEGSAWTDLAGMGLEDVGDILDQSNHNVLEFALMDMSGQLKTVSLKKEKISDEDNIVKSFVLKGERNIGYIYLPGFYTDVETDGGSRCANDVAAAIIKLKKENIEGLVLDVRFNGGGSLTEAVAMAGIFIDAGPVGLLKERNGTITSEKDMNRGTIYNGPLLLMVNAASASASEFLAAALQDYRRAVVVGSRTFGKATAQHLHTLNPKSTTSEFTGVRTSQYGYAAVTQEKIYRVNGRTAQRMGVQPDIALPDFLNVLAIREEDKAFTLPSDSVQKKTYYQPLLLLPLKDLTRKSRERVAASEIFSEQNQMIQWLQQRNSNMAISLLWSDVVQDRKDQIRFFKAFANEQPTNAYTVKLDVFDEKRSDVDEYSRNFYDAWIKKLQRDKLLEEAFYILNDHITLTKKQ